MRFFMGISAATCYALPQSPRKMMEYQMMMNALMMTGQVPAQAMIPGVMQGQAAIGMINPVLAATMATNPMMGRMF
jgi:hypothetical protein